MSKLKAKAPELVVPGKTKALLFGAAGVGKTWFTLGFPVPYYIDTEGGADLKHYQERLKAAGGAYLGPDEGSLDYDVVLDQMQALATEKHPYKTLIIDSITKIFQTAIANEQERLGEKDAFGASKKPAIAGMRRIVNWCNKLDMNIWFVAHEVSEWGVNPKSGNREEIGKMPDVWDKLIYELDLGLRIVRRGKEYPAIAIVHKSRLLGFPLNESFSLDYDTFSEKYGKDYIEAETKTITLASPEQLQKMNLLLEIFKIPVEEQEKMLNKGNATKWNELESAQIEKYITFLNSKVEGKK